MEDKRNRTDILFIKTAPDEIVQGTWYRMPLLGIGYLAAWLREKKYTVAIVDAMFDKLTRDECVERILLHNPRMLCITAMTHEINRAAELAEKLETRGWQGWVVVGGPHCSALPARTLEEYPVFDFAITGEGERTLSELAGYLLRKKIPIEQANGRIDELIPEVSERLKVIKGLVWRNAGSSNVNEPRPWIRDLDKLPFPAWDLYGRAELYQIYASRGCPFQCVFCMRVLGEQVRYRSPEKVVDEFEWVVNTFHPKRIDFSDETFTLKREWTESICDELIRRGLHKRMPWFANGRVNTVDVPLLRKMKEAGCVRLGFGIESGNPEILKAAQKATTIEQIEKAIAACKEVGLEMEAFYILGFPGETKETARDTIRLAARLNTTTAAFGIMVPYPGTRIAEMAEKGEGGYRMLSHDWSDFDKHLGNAMELETLSRRELESLQARAYLWFYLRNFRIRDLAGFAWEKRKAAVKLGRKLLGMK